MTKLFWALTLCTAVAIAPAQASAAIVVDFTFNGSPLEPGTVTGHLVFDTSGTNVQATGVYVDTATATVAGFEDYNFLTGARVSQNSFTVTADGIVTSAALSLSNTYAYGNVATTWVQLNGFGGYNDFEQDYASYYNGSYFKAIENQGSFAGTTYSAPAAVPETATWSMLIVGFGLVGAAARRKAAPALA